MPGPRPYGAGGLVGVPAARGGAVPALHGRADQRAARRGDRLDPARRRRPAGDRRRLGGGGRRGRRPRQRDRGRGHRVSRRGRPAGGRRGDRAAERFVRGVVVTGATIDVQRPPTGWSHLSGPLLHVLVALTPADQRYAAASTAADGGDLDDVLDALASEGMRRTPAFVAVAGASRPRVVTHADGYAVLTSARGTLEVRAHHTRVWSDLVADEDVDTVALRVSPPWVAPWLSNADPPPSEGSGPDHDHNPPPSEPAPDPA